MRRRRRRMGKTASHSSLVWNQPDNQFHHSDSGWQLLFQWHWASETAQNHQECQITFMMDQSSHMRQTYDIQKNKTERSKAPALIYDYLQFSVGNLGTNTYFWFCCYTQFNWQCTLYLKFCYCLECIFDYFFFFFSNTFWFVLSLYWQKSWRFG